MITRRLLLAAPALLVPGALAAADPDPAAIVTSIYDGSGDIYGAAVALQMRSADRRALSKSLAALWNRSDANTPKEDEPVPGFDIASNSQELEVKSAEVKVERQEASRATVMATLIPEAPNVRNSPEENILRYDFVRENGRWKIDDVRGTIHPKAWSIRRILSESLKRR